MAKLPCDSCFGACCQKGAHGFSEVADFKFEPKCPNLTDDNKCKIYEDRPDGCKDFDCSTHPTFRHKMPEVAALLGKQTP